MINFIKFFIFYVVLMSCHVSYGNNTDLVVYGKVWDNTCEIDVNSQNFIVDLGPNSILSFLDLNRRGPKNRFNITLSRCGDSAKGAYVTFTGIQNDEYPNFLKINKFVGSATGLAIIIEDENDKTISINKPNALKISLLPHQKNIVAFSATLVATKLPVTTGKIMSSANFTFEYL